MKSLPKNISRLLIAALVVECVVLGTVQVRRWFANRGGGQATQVSAPGTEALTRPPSATEAPSSRTTAPQRDLGASPRGAPAAADRPDSKVAGSAAVAPGIAPSAAGPRAAPEADRAGGAAADAGGVPADAAPVAADRGPVPGPAGRSRAPASGPSPAPVGRVPDPSASPSSGASVPVPNGVVMQTPSMPATGSPAAGADGHPPAAPKHGDEPSKEPGTHDDQPAGENPTVDDASPVLEGLRFDPAEVQGGAATTLTVQASDAGSGIKSLWGEVRSPNRSAALPFGSANPGPGPVFQFPISVPALAQTGTWYVAWISLTDGAGNTRLIQAASASAAPPGGTFAAFSSESDATAPEVLQVFFDRTAVSPGEKNVIEVQVQDDLSGVASVTGACQSPSKSALIWFNAVSNADGTAWLGDVTLPATADCGEWVVQQLSVKDKAGNTTLLHADAPVLARAGFGVSSGSGCDFTAPTLDAFDLAPAAVPGGTAAEILVTARVSDEGSGVAGLTGWFEGPAPAGGQAPKNYFSCTADPGDPTAPWTGRIQVPALAARGTWKVGSIRIEDKARNVRTYTSADPVVSGRVFRVQ